MKEFCILIVCVAALFIGLYNVVNYLPPAPFAGEIFLPGEGEAGVAIARSGQNKADTFASAREVYPGRAVSELTEFLPIQAIPLLDEHARYDVAFLPFTLGVVMSSVLDEAVADSELILERDGGDAVVAVSEGDTVTIGGAEYAVTAIRRWWGLWRHAEGRPMFAMAAAIEGNPWHEGVFAEAGQWTLFEPEGALGFAWTQDEAGGRAFATGGEDALAGARWGVEEESRTLWFEGVQVGSGATLEDGTDVTLIALNRTEQPASLPIIDVLIRADGEERVLSIPANTTSVDGLIRFDAPNARRYTVRAASWMDNRAYVTVRVAGETVLSRVMQAGELWALDDGTIALRFDNAFGHALPIARENSTAYEAVLEGTNQVLRLRHGERVRVGDDYAQFRRRVDPARVELRLAANHADSEKVTTFMLNPGSSFRVLSWRLTAQPVPEGMDAFLIHAEYEPGLPLRAWIGGALAAVASALALFRLAVLFRRSHAAR